MTNYFDTLNIPISLHLPDETIQEAYKVAAASAHPDSGGSENDFKVINTAKDTLIKASTRTRHFIELHGCTYHARGAVSDEVMELFMPIADVIQLSDTQQQKLDQASSPLTKAMLTQSTLEIQDQIESLIDLVHTCQQHIFSQLHALNEKLSLPLLSSPSGQLPQPDQPAENSPSTPTLSEPMISSLSQTARDLAFTEKWITQLKEHFAKLFI